MIRILSIDGGGIRGIIPAQVLIMLEHYLKQLSQNPEARISDYFDLIAGTSTGGILTALYLLPDSNEPTRPRYNAIDILNLYLKYGNVIFHKNWFRVLCSANGLFFSKYSSKPFENLLLETFESTRLSDLLKPCLIPAFDIMHTQSLFFTQLSTCEHFCEEDFLLRDVIRSTTAAPTYFPTANISSLDNTTPYTLIDGGMIANNPAMCAYIEAYKLLPTLSPENTLILSLGTGYSTKDISSKALQNAGIIRWALPMFNILMSSDSAVVDHKIKVLFQAAKCSEHYLRIQTYLNSEQRAQLDLDEVTTSSLNLLQEIGYRTAQDYKKDIEAFAHLLVAAMPSQAQKKDGAC